MSTGEVLIPLFGMIGFFGAIITFIYMRYKSRHAERMALIESGQSADMLTEPQFNSGERGLKTGLFFIGGGLGFMFGRVIERIFDLSEGMGFISMGIVGAGIGLVTFYFIMQRKHK